MNIKRPLAAVLLLLVFALTAGMFYRVIWIPLYRDQETRRFVGSQDAPALQVDVERQDATGTRAWTLKDQQSLQKLKTGLQSAEAAPAGDPPASDQKYRIRIKRSDSRTDEYELLLGPEGRMQDRLYVIRRSGDTSIYGTAYNTPELRSALQQVLVAPAPK